MTALAAAVGISGAMMAVPTAANAIPLGGFHHRRIHDDHYTVDTAPDGSLRFTHRWPSLQRRQDAARYAP